MAEKNTVELDETQTHPDAVDNFDSEKGKHIAAVSAIEVEYTREEEKQLLKKLDWNIIPYLAALYLLAYLDRGNIGNANTAGMSEDTGMSDGQYQWLLTIFYISYIVFEWMILLWKVLPPRYYVPCVVIGWGICSSCLAAVKSWAPAMVLRFLLGVCEAGFGPGVPYYLTFFYYRHEMKRTALFLSTSSLASAFSGALAYGITQHQTWRVLYLVEGLPTILVGAIGFYAIPNDINDCKFLTEREKQIGNARTARQTGSVDRGGHKINFREIIEAVTDPKNLVPSLMFFSVNVSFSSLPVFLPTILKDMGFEAVRAQGLSAPPYVLTTIIVIISAFLSDKLLVRGLFITVLGSIGAAGYLILAVCENTAVKYFAVYLAAAGIFPCVSMLIMWVGNNQGSDTKRGTGFVLLQIVGQCGPLLGTRLFPESDGPYYKKGFYTCFGFMAFVAVLSLVLRFYLQWLNKKLDEKYGPAEGNPLNPDDALGMEGDDNPNFRYIL